MNEPSCTALQNVFSNIRFFVFFSLVHFRHIASSFSYLKITRNGDETSMKSDDERRR
jgi:hypothetical protein